MIYHWKMNGLILCVHTYNRTEHIYYSHILNTHHHRQFGAVPLSAGQCSFFFALLRLLYNWTLLSSSSFNHSNSNRNIHNDDSFHYLCSWKHINSNIAWGYSLSRSADAFHFWMRGENVQSRQKNTYTHIGESGNERHTHRAQTEWQIQFELAK